MANPAARRRRPTDVLDNSAKSVRQTCACGGVTLFRPGTNPPVQCAFCEAPLPSTRESTSEPSPEGESMSAHAGVATAPVRRRVFIAEIVCLLCGREAGVAVAEHWPPTGPILFQPADKQEATQMRAWWRLRCVVCGGNTTANEVASRTARLEPSVDWREVRPRRGRPPKWLVEQRRAAAPND
jgi:hypothetical protein